MKEIKNKIINSLEFGMATYVWEAPEDPDYEICRWVPNEYYSREKDFIKDGDYYIYPKLPNCKVHKDCFKRPQKRYTIALFHKRKNGNYGLKVIGNRLQDLTPEELQDFSELKQHGFEVLNNKDENKEF